MKLRSLIELAKNMEEKIFENNHFTLAIFWYIFSFTTKYHSI